MMMNKVVASLHKEYSRLEKEMGQVGKALDALGHAGGKKLKMTGRSILREDLEHFLRSERDLLR